jgi:hypothetical protein
MVAEGVSVNAGQVLVDDALEACAIAVAGSRICIRNFSANADQNQHQTDATLNHDRLLENRSRRIEKLC